MTRDDHQAQRSTRAPADTTSTIRQRLHRRRQDHQRALVLEAERLAAEAAAMGVQRVVLFGSMVEGDPGLASDLDLLIVWDTPMDFVTRTAELYRRLQPRVAADLLAYTPDEFARMADRPFIRNALKEGKVLYAA